MPRPVIELPTELRHVYRSLLRAASYLPDAEARKYFHGHIKQRFRGVATRISHEKGETQARLLARYHSSQHVASVRRDCNKLERAGLGHAGDLEKVLWQAYGRIGRRKRELMKDLLLDSMSYGSYGHLEASSLEHLMTSIAHIPLSDDSKFHAVLINQNQSSMNKDFRIRRVKPEIDEVNRWMRPMPKKRVLNMTKRWWASSLGKLLPPLPNHEWNRLQDLATGAIPIDEPPNRRTPPFSSIRLEGEENDKRLLQYFTLPVSKQKDDLETISIGNDGIFCWTRILVGVKIPHDQAYKHTPRFMRRIYARILEMTPRTYQERVLEKTSAHTGSYTMKWRAEFGRGLSAFHSGRISKANPQDDELFEGIENVVVKTRTKSDERKMSREPKYMVDKNMIAKGAAMEEQPEMWKQPVRSVVDGWKIGIVPNIYQPRRSLVMRDDKNASQTSPLAKE